MGFQHAGNIPDGNVGLGDECTMYCTTTLYSSAEVLKAGSVSRENTDSRRLGVRLNPCMGPVPGVVPGLVPHGGGTLTPLIPDVPPSHEEQGPPPTPSELWCVDELLR